MSTLAKLLMGVSGAEPVPTEPGTPFEGGYYAGRIMVEGVEYALVVAPKSQGGQSPSGLQWKTSSTTTAGTDSINDGKANTANMIAAGAAKHPAAAFCRGLNINGYGDWYLPAKDELEILYRAFKPSTDQNNTNSGANPSSIPPRSNYTSSDPEQTSLEIFKEGGSEFLEVTWSSTQSSAGNSWYQSFVNGLQSNPSKTFPYMVRAVRRVAI